MFFSANEIGHRLKGSLNIIFFSAIFFSCFLFLSFLVLGLLLVSVQPAVCLLPRITQIFFWNRQENSESMRAKCWIPNFLPLLTIWLKRWCLRSLPLLFTKQNNHRTLFLSFHISSKLFLPPFLWVLHLCGLRRNLGWDAFAGRLNFRLSPSLPVTKLSSINIYWPATPGGALGIRPLWVPADHYKFNECGCKLAKITQWKWLQVLSSMRAHSIGRCFRSASASFQENMRSNLLQTPLVSCPNIKQE